MEWHEVGFVLILAIVISFWLGWSTCETITKGRNYDIIEPYFDCEGNIIGFTKKER